MRQDRIIQASIFDVFAAHEIGHELRAMSQWLDLHRQLLSAVAADLRRDGLKQTGRHGLPAEAVLRCGLLKQYRQLSYEELAFHLQDSASFRAFARLPVGWCPKKSVLQKTISAVCAETWEQINRVLLTSAKEEQIESGAVLRLDSTTSAALLHEPSDSSLLWDAVRVMVRLLQEVDELCAGAAPAWCNHRRLAKRRALAIKYSRSPVERVKLYRELIGVTRTTLGHLQAAAAQMPTSGDLAAEAWQVQVRHYQPLIERIIAQSERRVLAGEPVPASEKLVSLFEPHADIIRKGSEVAYGHKLSLSTGRSGLILDLMIEAGNPADSERLLPMLERHIARYGKPPRQAAADGSYASRDNLSQAKARGVRDMAFHKKGGLRIEDMVRSRWVYRKLRNFRAGIEADISCLKRAYGLARCTWRGLGHFRAYVWSAVVAYNLALFARLQPA
ncbi:MAG: ISNCY family transposase [Geminicoccales bacterium]